MKKKTHLLFLLEKRFGYIMLNEKHNIEVKCTPEYKTLWTERGFKVIKTIDNLQLIS